MDTDHSVSSNTGQVRKVEVGDGTNEGGILRLRGGSISHSKDNRIPKESGEQTTLNQPRVQEQQTDFRSGKWGDNIKTLDDNDVRFVFQNVNGLSRNGAIHEEFKQNMVRLGGHITGITESNVNWRNFGFRDQWETTLQRNYATLHFSHLSCNEGSVHPLQRGGTSMVCNSRIGAHMIAKGNDSEMGRWSWMRFRGNNKRHILVISAYQVSQHSAKGLGTETCYMQQWRKLRAKHLEDTPRTCFWKDLTIFIRDETKEGKTDTIVMLDANADHSDASFSQMLVDCNLSDLHDDPTLDIAPATYYRGTRRIDYILGSPGITRSVTRTGILAFNDGLKYSDHRAVFIDVSEAGLFSDSGSDPISIKTRGLQTSNRKQVEKCCALLREKLLAHNIFQRCNNLRKNGKEQGMNEVKAEADAIDKQITGAALKAEQQSSNKVY